MTSTLRDRLVDTVTRMEEVVSQVHDLIDRLDAEEAKAESVEKPALSSSKARPERAERDEGGTAAEPINAATPEEGLSEPSAKETSVDVGPIADALGVETYSSVDSPMSSVDSPQPLMNSPI